MNRTLFVRSLFMAIVLLSGVASCYGVTPLMQAAKTGDAAKIEKLIDNGVHLDETSEYGWTALMFAANAGHSDVVRLLLNAGANPNIESQRITGNTQAPYPKSNALREAIDNDHLELARILLDNGAQTDPTAFAMAGGSRDLGLLEKMLAMGADPNTPSPGPDAYHPSALCVASVEGHLETVEWLIERGADPNLSALDCSPLFSAVASGNQDVVRFLLTKGADPNFQSRWTRMTPLLHNLVLHTRSSQYDANLEITKLLLSEGADQTHRVDDWPYQNRSALEYVEYERDRAAERSELPGFESDWPGGIPQWVDRFDTLATLLRE